jgi:hypothetical protein
MQTTLKRPLSASLRHRVNTFTHTAGTRHAAELRTRLLAELAALVASGHKESALHFHLDQLTTESTK